MLTPGTILQGRYLVIRQLSRGGMGAVYLVKHQQLGRTFALKETFFSDDEVLRRAFEREAQLLANLDHSGLPRVTDHFTEGESQFLLMEYIPGEDLGVQLRAQGKPFRVDLVLDWADELLDVLEYLHGCNPPIIHRDIKPENLKLNSRGKIVLLDFGLAKGSVGEMSHASRSIFGFTPNYASFEQTQGDSTDARSDLYSLAATLYHLMTGQMPPQVITRMAAVADGQPDPLRPANEVNAAVSAEVAGALAQGLARTREKRPVSATAMRKIIREARGSQRPRNQDAFGLSPTLVDQVPPLEPAPETRSTSSRYFLTEEGERIYVEGDSDRLKNVAQSRISELQSKQPETTVLRRKEIPTPRLGSSDQRRLTRVSLGWLVGVLMVLLVTVALVLWATVIRSNRNSALAVNEEPTTTGLKASDATAPGLNTYEFKPATIDASGTLLEGGKTQARFFAEDLGSGVRLEMVEVPGGSFLMGSPIGEEGRWDEEGPQHQVTVARLFVGRFEVNQAQWEAVTQLPRVARNLAANPSQFKNSDLPVDRVSWEDAREFCARLSRKSGRAYRLPSEAEWEYACRSGTTTPFYVGSWITSEVANLNGEKPYGGVPTGVFRRRTTRVGSLPPPNNFGLFDMAGNVREWCLDRYHENYNGAPSDGSAWEAGADEDRVARGGAWYNAGKYCRSAARPSKPDPHLDGMGFRVVMAIAK